MAQKELSSSKYLGEDYFRQADRERAREEFKESAETVAIWGFCAVIVTAIALYARTL